MALPEFTMRQLLEAGAHFGHRTQRWNPKMAPYIYGSRNDIHIIDLTQTVPLLHQALVALRDVAAGGGRILFVGTKRQASEPIAAAAKRCAQYYVNHRWLGGTLTNWQTISQLDQAHAQDRGDAEFGAELGPDEEGAARPAARARQARALARRHQGDGRPAQHAVRDRHQQGSDRDLPKPRSSASRSRRSSIRTAIRTASPIRSRAMTTPPARSCCIAISPRARSSTASARARSTSGVDVGAAEDVPRGRAPARRSAQPKPHASA